MGMGIGMIVMALAAVILGEALIYPRGITWTLIACFSGTFLYRLFITIALRLGMRPGDLKMIRSQDDNITPGSRGTGNSISQEETVSRMGAPRIQDVMLK
ncbi:MAG: hypothetical protein JRI84_06860 [Deltaproteobacteria bacterium]|nr:hypothetical protein [Deltaproteobacteria bacterium]